MVTCGMHELGRMHPNKGQVTIWLDVAGLTLATS